MGTLSVQPPSGSMRSLTEVFILLRNNAIQSRQIFASASSSLGGRREEKMHLVSLNGEEADVELGLGNGPSSRIPPDWVNVVDEVQYEMTRVRNRLKELREQQQKHLTRPSFNDDSSQQEESKIEASTQEVTQMLAHCHRLIRHIRETHKSNRGDEGLLRNVVSSSTQSLQQLTLEFRQSQTGYLKDVQTREDSLQQYFEAFSADDATFAQNSSSADPADRLRPTTTTFFEEETSQDPLALPPALTMAQIQALEDNTTVVREREREVLQITKSIVELNQLFRDLAQFVVDQGTVLDQIDFNIDNSNVRVKSGLAQVRKAEVYQMKNRKMHCILLLSAAILIVLFLLVIKAKFS